MFSELLKLRYNRSTTMLAAAAAAAVLLAGIVMLLIDPLLDALIGLNDTIPNATNAESLDPATRAALQPDSPGIIWLLANITSSSGGDLGVPIWCALIIGAVAATWEYRTGSIIPTMLAESRPWRVVAHKTAAVGAAVTAGSLALVAISAGLLLTAREVYDASLPAWPDLLGNWLIGTVGLGLVAMLGTLIGFLIRSQLWTIIAIVAAGLLETGVRQLSVLFSGDITVAQLLPFGLPADALHSEAILGIETQGLGAGAALIVLTGWVLAAAAAAVLTVSRREPAIG